MQKKELKQILEYYFPEELKEFRFAFEGLPGGKLIPAEVESICELSQNVGQAIARIEELCSDIAKKEKTQKKLLSMSQ